MHGIHDCDVQHYFPVLSFGDKQTSKPYETNDLQLYKFTSLSPQPQNDHTSCGHHSEIPDTAWLTDTKFCLRDHWTEHLEIDQLNN